MVGVTSTVLSLTRRSQISFCLRPVTLKMTEVPPEIGPPKGSTPIMLGLA